MSQRSASRKNLRNEKPSHSTKHVTDSLLQDELDATTHEKQIADDVTIVKNFKIYQHVFGQLRCILFSLKACDKNDLTRVVIPYHILLNSSRKLVSKLARGSLTNKISELV